MPPEHERALTTRHRAAVTTTAALATLGVIAAAMAAAGHDVDPWSGALAIAATLAVLCATGLARPRRDRELREHADRETGVGNVRSSLALIDRELTRARGHASVFSLVLLELDHALFADATPRRARRCRRELYRTVAADLRLDDRVCRVPTARHDLMLVLLPETGQRGARDVAGRLAPMVRNQTESDGLTTAGHLRVRTLAHPTDTAAIDDLRHRLQVLEDADALVRDIAVQPVRMPRRSTEIRSIRGPDTTTPATSTNS